MPSMVIDTKNKNLIKNKIKYKNIFFLYHINLHYEFAKNSGFREKNL